MARGTPAIGKRHQKTHTFCKRCGRQTFHIQKYRCASCGFPAARLRLCIKMNYFQTADGVRKLPEEDQQEQEE